MLGDTEGTVEMFRHDEHLPSSSFLRTTKTCESLYPFTKSQSALPVKLMPLDKWGESLSSKLLPEMIIKLDVQGYENKVIQGGRETFRSAKACIVEVCLDQLHENQSNFKNIIMLLYELGYHYAGNLEQIYGDDGHVIYIDAVFTKLH